MTMPGRISPSTLIDGPFEAAPVSVSTLVDGLAGALFDGSRSRSGTPLEVTGMGIGYQRASV